MENMLAMDSGYEMVNNHLESLKGGNKMEGSIKLNNDSFDLSIPEEKSKKLTIIFKCAQAKIEKALRLQDVERDIEKTKEFYSYGSYIG
ncbi:hypothetical protein [Isachenkonia alkalipeptolytica]|uniref:Uncharacterized protein n=1 Tax=Isachenkonia alkalipeptolytica TaxID=2565777 RepID=A0AA43XP22_9CLOT|nr:hypothetical protein [Isachenkonia alkalipeptolytica]NBG89694.1 hypothetical protein [Isachenkonia alkalipeptolytica]